MSKQSKAKDNQGYIEGPIPKTCATCVSLAMDRLPVVGWDGKPNGYMKETNVRCAIGGFAVRKTATCNEWKHNTNQ